MCSCDGCSIWGPASGSEACVVEEAVIYGDQTLADTVLDRVEVVRPQLDGEKAVARSAGELFEVKGNPLLDLQDGHNAVETPGRWSTSSV